jgi:hypothetical protein
MSISLQEFMENYSKPIDTALEFEEYDRAVNLLENLFLTKNLGTEVRIVAGTLVALALGKQLLKLDKRGRQLKASMALNAVEQMAIKDHLAQVEQWEKEKEQQNG